MMYIKKILKFLLAKKIILILKKILINYDLRKYKKLSNKKIFSNIYKFQKWNNNNKREFKRYNSGPGSDNGNFALEYQRKISEFLQTLKTKPIIADLGCGDFEIGSKLVDYSSKYYAIDIFEDLISFNKKKFYNLEVDFMVLDITTDELPYADIYIVRQVLQHLSNDSIFNFLKKMEDKCKYLIITEHLPDKEIKNFKANKDITTGPYIRLHENSGVVLTEKPFNLKTKNRRRLFFSEADKMDGVLDTTLLQIK
jgi:hypothetical protein